MKKLLLILGLFIFTFYISLNSTVAQTGFERVYGDLNDASSTIQLCHDSGYVLGGSSRNFPPNQLGYILKIDSRGDSLWSRYYSNTGFSFANGTSELLTHSFAVPGGGPDTVLNHTAAATVRIVDSTGNITSRYIFPEVDAWSTWGNYLISNRDSGFAFTYYTDGFTSDNYDRINVKGRTYNWEDRLGGEGAGWPFYSGVNDISQNYRGEYYGLVNYGNLVDTNNGTACMVRKWSEAGTLLLDSFYFWGSNTESIFGTDDGGAVFCGNSPVRLIKIDSTGMLEWDFSYTTILCYNAVQAIQTRDHGYAVISNSGPIALDTNNISLLKFDSNGNLLWIRNFGGINEEVPYQFQETFDSGFIILGHSNSFGPKHIYVIKTDSLGYINQNYFITSASNVYCAGDTAYLSVQQAMSYQWSTGDTIQQIAITQTGSYTVTVTDSTGNTVTTAYYSVFFNTAPFAELNVDSVSGICQNSFILNSLTNYPGLQYDWYLNDTLLPLHTPQLSPTLTGLYKLIISNNCGIASDSVMIDTIYPLPPIPVIIPSYTPICPGDSALLTTSFDSLFTYQWFYAPSYSQAFSPIPQSNDSGIYAHARGYYQVHVSYNTGCVSSSYSIYVSYYQPPAITYAGGYDTLLCPNDSVRLEVCCGSGYLWNTGETAALIWAKNSGDYYATAVVSGICPLPSDTIHLTMQPALQISLGNDTVLCGASSLALHLGSTYNSYMWSDGSTADSLLVTNSGTYSVQVELANSCPGLDTIQVSLGLPHVDLGPDTTICNTHTVTLDAGSDFASYLWNDGSGNQTLLASTTSTGIDTTNYFVTVTDTNGCSNRDSIQIIFNICSGVGKQDIEKDITIYPNPATKEITLAINNFNHHKNLVFELFDLTGRIILFSAIEKSEQKIRLNDLPGGVYQYKIYFVDGNLKRGKLIIE